MNKASPCQSIEYPLFKQHKLTVSIKRDDLLHPLISGNKWRKLKANIKQLTNQEYQGIISFGGCYSNHLHALAYACKLAKIPALAIVRGEPEHANNATLAQISAWGMQLQFVNRITYRRRAETDYLAALQAQYPQHLIIPEGGSNSLALPGVSEVISELAEQVDYDHLLLPVGSGGTIAGLIEADQNQHSILGVAVLQQADYLRSYINSLLSPAAQHFQNWQLLTDFHRGGYAKFSAVDAQRILAFSRATGIPLEPIYSGKMILALLDLIAAGFFKPHSRIVLVHTGGLQGLNGLAERQLLKLADWQITT